MPLLSGADVAGIASDNLTVRFGDNFSSLMKEQQVIAILAGKPRTSPDSDTHLKFSQIMRYLTFPSTWYSRDRSAVEKAFQTALHANSLLFPVISAERVEHISKPLVGWRPLDAWLGQSDGHVNEYYANWTTAYSKIERWLKKKHPYNQSAVSRLPQDQQRLTKYFDLGVTQTSVENFDKPQNLRRPRLRVRLDIVYNPLGHEYVFAEVKPTSVLGNKELSRRLLQLAAYDTLLKFKGDERTPLSYVLPTICTHREQATLKELSSALYPRPIIPICITTEEYLRRDLETRTRSSEYVLEVLAPKGYVSPAVAEIHQQELAALQGLEGLV